MKAPMRWWVRALVTSRPGDTGNSIPLCIICLSGHIGSMRLTPHSFPVLLWGSTHRRAPGGSLRPTGLEAGSPYAQDLEAELSHSRETTLHCPRRRCPIGFGVFFTPTFRRD